MNMNPEKLVAYTDMYLRALDSIYDGVAIYDDTGKNVYVNTAHLTQIGVSPDSPDQLHEYLSTNIHNFISISPPICSQPITEKAINSWRQESGIVKYFRTNKTCLVSAVPLTLENGERIIVSVVRDMTELLELQKQLEDSDKLKQSYANQLEKLGIMHSNSVLIQIKSKSMVELYSKARRIADTAAPVLILGETGVGKDFLARHIHENSDWKPGPFVKVNCGAIPGQLLESELFGYEAGAFTGASRRGKTGLIEMANRGTLYLDEVGEMPTDLQVKLLGVLQDRQITRVGGTKPIEVNFRLISATNADLEKRIKQGAFRQDLFYRLNVVTLTIPPLRERTEDIFPLVEHFLREMNASYKKETYFESEALEMILHYPWYGNIRELKNIIEQMVVLAVESRLTAQDLSAALAPNKNIQQEMGADFSPHSLFEQQSLRQVVEQSERQYLSQMLATHTTMREAASAMGIDLSTLVRKKKNILCNNSKGNNQIRQR